MKAENSTRIQFDSLSSNEAYARGVTAAFLARYDPTVPQLADLKTAVSEAVTNCIVHAYKNRPGDIYIAVRVYDTRKIKIEIKDKGCGIADVTQARTPMYSTGGDDRSGMGFTIMESFMTELKVTSSVGRGTTVHMKRRIIRRGEKT